VTQSGGAPRHAPQYDRSQGKNADGGACHRVGGQSEVMFAPAATFSSPRKHAFARSRRNVGAFCLAGLHRPRSAAANYDASSALASEAGVARWYDPSTAQFMSLDPLVAETGQPYGYANENPVNQADPTGLGGGSGCNTPGNQELKNYCNSQAHQMPKPNLNSPGPCPAQQNLCDTPDYAGGEGGVCLGGELVTPFGGIVLQVCAVGGIQSGVTFTHAWGSRVRGLAAGAGVSGFTSNAQCVQQLGGPFHAIGGSVGPIEGSHATGGGVTVYGYGLGVSLPGGVYDTTTNTNRHAD